MKKIVLNFIMGLMQLAIIIEMSAVPFLVVKNFFYTSSVNLGKCLLIDLIAFAITWTIGVICYNQKEKL